MISKESAGASAKGARQLQLDFEIELESSKVGEVIQFSKEHVAMKREERFARYQKILKSDAFYEENREM